MDLVGAGSESLLTRGQLRTAAKMVVDQFEIFLQRQRLGVQHSEGVLSCGALLRLRVIPATNTRAREREEVRRGEAGHSERD